MVTSINAPDFIEVPHVELPTMEQVASALTNDGMFGNYNTALNWLSNLQHPQEIEGDTDEDNLSEECELDSDDEAEGESEAESETDEPNSYVSNVKINYTGTKVNDTWQFSSGTFSWIGSLDNTANVHFFKEQMKNQLSHPVFAFILEHLECTQFQISVELNPLTNPSVMVAETRSDSELLPPTFTDTVSHYAEYVWNIERPVANLEFPTQFGDDTF